jgi:GT2 family glycosyltransferase
MSKIGLVTVLYKSENVLPGFIRSISNQTHKDYHVYFIDNSPASNEVHLIENLTREFPLQKYTYIQNESNLGVAAGNNQGIKKSLEDGCDYILLLNNDIEFSQDFLLEKMVQYANQNNEDLLFPKIYYFDSKKIWLAGGRLNKFLGTVTHIGDLKEDRGQFNRIKHFNYAPTCFMLISRKVFMEVGLMDERYFVYYDDTDFLFRAVKLGFRAIYLPALEVFHKVSSSTGGVESLFSIFYLTRNRIYFLRKNFPFIHRIVPMLYTLITRWIRGIPYKKEAKENLKKAIREGFSLEIPQ